LLSQVSVPKTKTKDIGLFINICQK
jgi:hypothetical protein